MRNRIILLIMAFTAVVATAAPQVLTLDECRQMACNNNRALRMASAEQQAAYYQRKSAFTNYLPKVTATGAYMYTSRQISLLSDEQQATLPHLGDAIAGTLAQQPAYQPLATALQTSLNAVGQSVVDALTTDTRNAGAIAVMLTQPIYMGGKIRAYNKIAQLAEEAAADKYDWAEQDLIVEVDETYWQIVALAAKKELAESYLTLVSDLERDVLAMVDAGMATQADALSVKVKINQAEVALIQVNNGLSLLKMLLCQLTGLDVNSEICLVDESQFEQLASDVPIIVDDLTRSWQTNRPELRALSRAAEVGNQRVKLALSETMPTIALTGGYALTNPSLYNGFENKFRGVWSVGVMVNIPIITWGDRVYKVKAAKANSTVAQLQLEEATEKIELQIAQSRRSLEESRQRLAAIESAVAVAEENLRMATLGMEEGVMPVLNVNEAQTAWLSARSELIAAKIDLKLSQIHLQRALGLTCLNIQGNESKQD